MEFFDSHCHLDPMRYGDDLPAVLQRARAAGVRFMHVIGTRAADSAAAADLAEREEGLTASAGIHPNDAADADDAEWEQVVRLVESGRVQAVGETGLDWYRDTAPPDLQRALFDRHIRLAQKTGLPLVIHTRESTDDVLAMLREALQRGPLTAVLHSFTGTAEQAAEALAIGCCIGFAGMATFRSGGAVRDVAVEVPADRLLIETDSPFLSPEPLRGRRNEPSHVIHTARCLAIARGETLESLAAATTANAKRLFHAG